MNCASEEATTARRVVSVAPFIVDDFENLQTIIFDKTKSPAFRSGYIALLYVHMSSAIFIDLLDSDA